MSYHVRLKKGLSYSGFGGKVRASKANPDVMLEDEAVARAAAASGYFDLVEEGQAYSKSKGKAKNTRQENAPDYIGEL